MRQSTYERLNERPWVPVFGLKTLLDSIVLFERTSVPASTFGHETLALEASND